MASNKQNPLDNYVTVAERIAAFYQVFPNGRICTHIIDHDRESGFILMRAEGYRNADDALPAATGHAFEVRSESFVNKTSYIENCESSSVGRMLAMLGFEVKRGLASREEMEKTIRMQPEKSAAASGQSISEDTNLDELIIKSAEELGFDAAKVRKWINQKHSVTGGLESLTVQDKREVLRIFREKAQAAAAKA